MLCGSISSYRGFSVKTQCHSCQEVLTCQERISDTFRRIQSRRKGLSLSGSRSRLMSAHIYILTYAATSPFTTLAGKGHSCGSLNTHSSTSHCCLQALSRLLLPSVLCGPVFDGVISELVLLGVGMGFITDSGLGARVCSVQDA